MALSQARAGDYSGRDDRRLGAEVNVLWPFPPFRTFEVKFRGTYRGFSFANEFYLGYAYYFGQSPVYVLPQWNAGFYAYKSYELPLNDNYVFDFLPKLSVGADF